MKRKINNCVFIEHIKRSKKTFEIVITTLQQ